MSGPDSHYYESGGLRLHYVSWGDKDAPPLILLHGGEDHCRNWDWTAKALSHRFHIIAPDLRGHGNSEWGKGNTYSISDFLYDLSELMSHLDINSFSVVGHSLGGAIVAKYMGIYPKTVIKGVIMEGLVPLDVINQSQESDPAEKMRNWIEKKHTSAGKRHRLYATQQECIDRMQAANSHLTPERARHLAIHGSKQNPDGSYSWKFDPMSRLRLHFDITAKQSVKLWQQIECPVLLMRGEDSWAEDPDKDGRIDYLKDARLVNFADAGHWLHHDQFELFIKVLDDFL